MRNTERLPGQCHWPSELLIKRGDARCDSVPELRPIELKPLNPLSRRFWRGRAKKPFVYKIAIAATSLALLGLPLLALANPFSWMLDGFGTQADAAGEDTTNSQRMEVLSPATNLDPNPTKGSTDLAVVADSALAASVGPSGTTADVEELPTSSQISVYTVRAGDTLSSIATMFGVSTNTIVWANDLKGGVVHEGDQLVILPVTGIRHTVTAGETLASIATKFGGNATEIAQFNGLDPAASLADGQTVLIPNGEAGAAAPSEAPKSGKTPPKKTVTGHKAAITKALKGEPYLGGSGPATGDYIWPVNGGQITQGLHGWNAVDIGAPKGTAIYAAAGGTVIVARDNGGWNGGYGNYVVISHPDGTQTLYAHMSQVMVSSGDAVNQGQTIGLVGATGEATGSHLHFEVRGAQNPFANY